MFLLLEPDVEYRVPAECRELTPVGIEASVTRYGGSRLVEETRSLIALA